MNTGCLPLFTFAPMEIDRNTTNLAVKQILDQLVSDLPGYRWERICSFSDGKDTTIMEVTLYRKAGSEFAARLSYRVETGELLNFQYPALHGTRPENAIDLLLDIHNLEHALAGKNAE